jgi:peroxiredoxin
MATLNCASQADALREVGVNEITCVAVGEPAEVDSWATKVGIDGKKVLMASHPCQAGMRLGAAVVRRLTTCTHSQVSVAADKNGSFTKMLGLDLGLPAETGARSLRWVLIPCVPLPQQPACVLFGGGTFRVVVLQPCKSNFKLWKCKWRQ